MLAGLWQRRSSDSKDHTLSILRTREDYDISGFDPAALDRAKFYLNHIQESNHICGVGGLVLSSIFVKGLPESSTLSVSWAIKALSSLLLVLSYIKGFLDLPRCRLSHAFIKIQSFLKGFLSRRRCRFYFELLPSGQVKGGTNQKYLEKDYLMKDGEPAHELQC